MLFIDINMGTDNDKELSLAIDVLQFLGTEKFLPYQLKEEFYKIGITSRSIKKRFCNKQTMPYKYQVLQEIEDISENIWDFEVFFKRLKFFRHYTPNIPFGGSLTECYLLNKEN